MKFSFKLIKKLAPGKYDKNTLVEKLNLYSFEADDLGEDVLDVVPPANRHSDAASHIGVAREASIIFNTKLKDPTENKFKPDSSSEGVYRVSIKDNKLCKRYLATYVTDVKVGPSPDWLKEVLKACGLRPINNVVDIMNYVMLEMGQPLHAFDADKVSGGLVVRNAKEKESIDTIDSQKFELNKDMLVIADAKKALAIAGIKGGKSSEVGDKTTKILVESANFDGVNIYKTAANLKLHTDASGRFSHNLNPALAEMGMMRALELLKELVGAKVYKTIDVYPEKTTKKTIKLDLKKINNLIGTNYKEKEIVDILKKLGFKKKSKILEVPILRDDVDNIEDVAEEIVRVKGYENLESIPPAVALGFAAEEESILLKDRIKTFLTGVGYGEVYNYSLVPELETGIAPDVFRNSSPAELANPMSNQVAIMRDSLAGGLIKNLKDNLRYFEEVKVFEIGRVFGEAKDGVKETSVLGVASSSKNAILELKGLVDLLFTRLGIIDYFLKDLDLDNKILKSGEGLLIKNGEHEVLGYLGSLDKSKGAILEIDLFKLLKEINEEKGYEPLSKYPSVVRDISILVSNVRVGEILSLIQQVSPKLVNDVDLIDWYQDDKLGHGKRSLTFRIVFQSDEKTLTDQEVDREMAIISQVLTEKFNAELR
ncbi:phenylalanine--tRNA ligase subunit beta [Candidatus Wolfebacteria bacterium]|nr:phenylalanine--tRNA ligase subunit beta [Candidatus Wolfebacteria bacterium]